MKNVALKLANIVMILSIAFLAVGCVTATQPPAATTAPVNTVAPAPTSAASSNTVAPAPTTASGAPQTIKIGFLTPLTGTSSALGKQVLQAANMIVDLINEDHPESHMALGPGVGLPNLGGAKIELVVADHKSDAATAVAEAKRLITEEHVVAITGEFTSALIKAVAVVTEQYQIPLLAAGSAVTLTDGSTPLQWFFRFGVNDATYIQDTFDFMKMLNDTQNAGIKTVAFFSEDSEFGANIVTQEVKYAALGGFTVVNNLTYPANSTDLTSEVLKIKASNPDVLIMASYSSDASLFINTAIEQEYTPKLIIGQRGGFIQPDYLSTMGVKNNYILTTGSWAADQKNVVAQELEALYPAKYSSGVALSDAHVKDIACLLFVAMAINQAGSTDAVKVRDAIHNFKFDPAQLFVAWKGISIDQYGQNTLANGIVAQYLNGKYQTVYPLAVAAAKAVYPMPGFGK